jgi:biopolymer transport protein ExbD
MADLSQQTSPKNGETKVRVKKQSTRIDMTPMVDLAFLLLTFFILTSTFNHHKIMQVDMPEKVENPDQLQPVSEEHILNLVLAENNKIFWWMGLTPPAEMTSYSSDGVRRILLEKNRADAKLVVLIKPKDDCKYENMVDILDEIQITNTKRFAIVDFTDEDKNKIALHK